MAEWLWLTLIFIGELGAIFLAAYSITRVPWNDARGSLIPEGWKIKRRGFLGMRGFDAKTPEGEWLGWTYRRKSWAVDHAWTCARFERAIKRMERDNDFWRARYQRRKNITDRSSSITPPSDGSTSGAGDGSA